MTWCIDYETRAEASIKLGVYRYTECPRFDVLMLAYARDDDPVEVALGHDDCLAVMREIWNSGEEIVAHNAQFERIVTSRLFDLPVGEYLPPERWVDTAAIAVEKARPRALGPLAATYAGGEQKDEAGTALINYFCSPITNGSRKGEFRTPEDSPEKWEKFVEYCRQDVETLRDIAGKLGSFPTKLERAAWNADQRINDRGVVLDMKLAEAAVEADADNRTRALARMKEITGLENPNSVGKLRDWLNDSLPLGADQVEDLRADTVEATLRLDLPDDVREVLELRQVVGLTASKKYVAAIDRVSPDGRLRGTAQFYGAHTGRFAGRGLQLQNLPRAGFGDGLKEPKRAAFDSDAAFEAAEAAYKALVLARRDAAITDLYLGLGASPHDLKALLRPLLVGPFAVADWNAIEARVLSWLAGEEWALEAFRAGRDLYVETAARMSETTGQEFGRQQGKAAVLGLGYMSGPNGLRVMGMDGTDEELRPVVKAWREANPRISRFWQDLDGAFRRGGVVGRIRIRAKNGSRAVYLPCGRPLIYRGVRERPFKDKDGKPDTWPSGDEKGPQLSFLDPRLNMHPARMHAGVLTENIVQAVARDLLVSSLVRCEAEGLRPVAHVHDEIICEGGDDPRGAADRLSEIMSAAPTWADGLPLKAPADVLDRYAK